MKDLKGSHIIVFVLGFMFLMSGKTLAQNRDLPWGKTQEPTLITPDENASQNNASQEDIRRNPLPDRDREIITGPSSTQRSYERPRVYRERRSDEDRSYRRQSRDYDGYREQPKRHENFSRYSEGRQDTYGDDEILNAGHRFFGKVSKGLARVIAYAFSEAGRPNGYILGEDAGGAFVAGVRYGEGTLITKYFGSHKVYWQGPSIGYDFGAEGSKTMILVYDLRHPADIYRTFAGVNGSAYIVGGVGLTFQKRGHVVLARIQSGVGLRLGANVGYLKYTRRPTWNPF